MRNRLFVQFFLISLIFSCGTFGYSQNRCSNILQEKFLEKVPEAKNSHQASIEAWKKKRAHTKRSSVEVTIPVHVIIVHPPGEAIGTGDNLSIERIQSQIDVMNEDFPGLNSDIGEVPTMFDVGASEISFCLATNDPDGNPTNGITRYPTNENYEDIFMTTIMPQTIWDNSLYLNIYVTSTIQDLGFSPVPSTAYTIPPQWDAPTVLTSAFGGPGYATQSFYDLGRTTVHEVGHWLGLNHVWGPTNGGCSEDDGMDDTPTQDQPNFACPDHPLPDCGNPAVFFMNFMDYVNDECMLAFSEDQVDYMHFIIEEVRPGLIGAHLSYCDNITPPDPVVVTILNTQNESCAGANDGSVEIFATGGDAPYVFSIDGYPDQMNGVFNNLGEGNYTVVVNDASGVAQAASFSIESSAPILVEIVAVTDPSCSMANGSFGVVASGGNPGGLTVTVNQTMTDPNNFFDNLSAGNYSIEVTDSQNCFEQVNYQLNNNTNQILIEVLEVNMPCGNSNNGSFEIQTTPENIAVTVNQTLTDPNNTFSDLTAGMYTISAQDDEGCISEIIYNLELDTDPFDPIQIDIIYPSASECETDPNSVLVEFVSSPSDGIDNIELDNGMTSTINMFSGMSAGNYTYTVSNNEGCSETGAFTIENNYYYDFDFTVNEPSCFNSSDGEISYSNNTGLPISITVSQGTPVAGSTSSYNNIPAGMHTVIVYGADDCILEEQEINFASSPIIETGLSITPDCASGLTQLQFTASGGNGTLTYELNGVSNTSGDFENLTAGIQTLTVNDENGCEETFEIEIFAIESAMTVNTFIEDEILCFGETTTVSLEIMGGAPPYQIIYDGISQSSNVISDVKGGIHSIIVQSNGDCAEDYETTLEIIEFEKLVVEDVMIIDSECSDQGGSFSANIFDGSPPYYYILDQTDTILVEDLPNLEDGAHSIQVIDAVGCSSELFEFDIIVSTPIAVDVEILNHVSCFGLSNGKVEIDVESSIGVTSFDWNDTNLNPQQLAAGLYSLTVTNPDDCTAVVDFEITQPDSLIIESEVLVPAGNLAGSASFTAAGGTAPYIYNVSGIENEDGEFSLLQGDYLVEITDANGCQITKEFTILLESANDDLIQEFGISFSPNPTDHFLSIDCKECPEESIYSIVNLKGETLRNGSIIKEKILDVSNYSQGVYLLIIEIDGRFVSNRFVVL